MFFGNADKVLIPGLLAFLLAAVVSCSGSDFAGGGSKNSGKTKGEDSDGGTGEADSGTAEAGDADSSDANDGDADGSEGSDAGDTGDVDGSDAGDADGDGVSDGDEELKKTRTDMKIVQTRADTKLRVKVELLSKAKTIQTEEFDSADDHGKVNKETILKNMCRKGLDTCVKVTFIGEKTQVAGGAACVFTSPLSDTKVKLDVDGNGAGLLGNCAPDEDETFEFSCDESKSLKVQSCNG